MTPYISTQTHMHTRTPGVLSSHPISRCLPCAAISPRHLDLLWCLTIVSSSVASDLPVLCGLFSHAAGLVGVLEIQLL